MTFVIRDVQRKLIFSSIFSIVFFQVVLAQTIYFVSSNDGNDSNSGIQPDQPWQSLAKVNNFAAKPGDQILFKSGDAWEGSLTVPVSGVSGNPIVYGVYGEGDKPKIYGSVKVTGWTLYSGNIYRAMVNQSDINQLFLDEKRMKLARFPNSGYIPISSVSSQTVFSSTSLNASVDYSKAVAIMRVNEYRLYAREVKSSNGKSLTLTASPGATLAADYGFWLANKLDFLDQPGEWYFDKEEKMLYLWTPEGNTPDNYEVRVSTSSHGVYIGSKNYIIVRDLEILHSGVNGVRITEGDHNRLENLTINFPDLTGVDISYGGSYNLIHNCHVYGSNGRGLSSYGSNTTFTNNLVERTGQHESINKVTYEHDGNNGTAIYSRSNNHIMEYNRLIDCGYNGICWQGLNTRIKYNYINGACQVMGDGGGIYGYKGTSYSDNSRTVGSVIEYNIVLNSYGNPAGAIKGYGDGFGIYLDGGCKGVTVRSNTVCGATSGAMYVNSGGGDNVVENNTFMNSILLLRANSNIGDVEIKNNIFYQTARKGTYGWSKTNPTHQKFVYQLNGAAFLFDYNTYVAHYNTSGVFLGGYSDFNDWKIKTGQDVHSSFDGSPLVEGETERLLYNDTTVTKVIELGDTIYRRLDGSRIEGTLTLDPFTSIILIKTGIISHYNAIENKTQNSFAYPNPTNGIIHLKTNNVEASASSISIFNMQGEKVYANGFIPSVGKTDDRLDISHLPEGCYLIQVNSPVGTDRIKIILKKDK